LWPGIRCTPVWTSCIQFSRWSRSLEKLLSANGDAATETHTHYTTTHTGDLHLCFRGSHKPRIHQSKPRPKTSQNASQLDLAMQNGQDGRTSIINNDTMAAPKTSEIANRK
jgi:hypothetical protein